MMKRVLILVAGLVLITAPLYAGNGDLIVLGNAGIGGSLSFARLFVNGPLFVSAPVYSYGWYYWSDKKFKKNIQPVNSSLDKILSLNGFSYEWKADEYKDKGFPTGRHYGVMAQEIERVLPEVVGVTPDGEMVVAYTEIIPVLIEAIKDQQKLIEKQQSELKEIRELVGRLIK